MELTRLRWTDVSGLMHVQDRSTVQSAVDAYVGLRDEDSALPGTLLVHKKDLLQLRCGFLVLRGDKSAWQRGSERAPDGTLAAASR